MDKIIVIGAGPAGMMAALTAAKEGKSVLLMDKNNQAGKKLAISGSGQCNLTHAGDIDDFSQHYGEKGRIASRILKRFSNEDLIAFFKTLGVPLKKREDGKYFPESLNSNDVIQSLVKSFIVSGGRLVLNNTIKAIEKKEGVFICETDKEKFTAKYVICATGGTTYPATGSDGAFFSVLERLNHTIIPLRKGLSPILTHDSQLQKLSGLSFHNAGLVYRRENGKTVKSRGDLLITHRGFSGPLMLDHSRYFQKGLTIHLNFTPFQDTEDLEQHVMAYSRDHGKKRVTALFIDIAIPKRLIDALFQKVNVSQETTFSHLTTTDRKKLSKAFAAYQTTIQEMGSIHESMVTAGGIDLKEIKLSTMESKIINNLFFCGEMIDIDGDTGGYNIQMAFSTGYIAGLSVSHRD